MKRKVLIALLSLTLLLSCFGCVKGKGQAFGNQYFGAFDTISSIYSFASDGEAKYNKRCNAVYELLVKYHQWFDIYNEYDGINNMATINKNAGVEPVKVDKEIIDFLLFCKDLYYKTNGKVNVMMGAVLRIWHDHRVSGEKDPNLATLPDYDELVEANKHTSIELLKIDEANLTVYITDPVASLDVGAIGKGYATERAADFLRDQKVDGYVLDIGGNLRMVGTKHVGTTGEGWVTGIRDPQSNTSSAIKLYLSNISCVTSGVYERNYEVDGVSYHHIIDSDTLYPSTYFDSVSIITSDSGLADALSTAIFCVSYEEGLEMIKNFDTEIGVIWIYHNGEIRYTDNIKDLIVE